MKEFDIPDELWERIEPLLPGPKYPGRESGRRRVEDRVCLKGILFVLAARIRWNELPQHLGYGSGMTCWRRLRAWKAVGVWPQVHALLLEGLHAADQIDWDRALEPSSHTRLDPGGATTGDQAR